MNKKKIVSGKEARDKMKKGIDKVYNAVSSTLGPNGHNVMIQLDEGKIVSTRDGVTVAKSIVLEDELENIGAQTIITSSIHANKIAGDGTTTATVLTHAIITEGLKRLEDDFNVTELKQGLEKTKDIIISKLDNSKQNITDKSDFKNIATVSANGDEKIGELISEAFENVGIDGVITVEKSNTGLDSLEIVEGLQFLNGYLSPYFVTNQQTMQVEFENPKYLLYKGKIQTIPQIKNILEYTAMNNISLVIIADDISGEALSTLIVNKVRGIARVCAVKAPGYGNQRELMMEDIATLTGGVVVSEEKGIEIENLTRPIVNEHDELLYDIDIILGSSRLFTCDTKQSTIIDGNGEVTKIEERVEQIHNQIERSDNDFEKQRFQERLAKMIGGVAIISVGGNSDIEIEDKKYRIEDSLNATKAAIEDGILPGGGTALMYIYEELNKLNPSELGINDNEQLIGFNILKHAIKQPFNKILQNAGLNGEVYWNEILNKNEKNYGFNLRTKKYVNMILDGIIDPTKVVKTSLEKAVSVASTFLLTDSVVININQKNKDNEEDYQEEY